MHCKFLWIKACANCVYVMHLKTPPKHILLVPLGKAYLI